MVSLFNQDGTRNLQKILWVLAALYLWVLPIAGTTALRNVLMVSILLCAAGLYLKQRVKLYFPLRLPWAAYGVVALFSLTYAISPSASAREMLPEYLYMLIVFFLAANLIRDEQALFMICDIVTVGVLFLSAWCVAQEANLIDALKVSKIHIGGSFSTYLITVMPLIALRAWYWFESKKRTAFAGSLLSLLAAIAAIYVMNNRMASLVLLVELIIISWALRLYRNRRSLLAAAGLGILLLSLFFVILENRGKMHYDYFVSENPALQSTQTIPVGQIFKLDPRWLMWKMSMEKIKDDPWRGAGFGVRSFDFIANSVRGAHGQHPHNIILHKGLEMGVPGILIFFVLFFSPLRFLWRHFRDNRSYRSIAVICFSVVVGVFLRNMFDAYFVRDGGLLYWLVVGAVLGGLYGEKYAFRKKDEENLGHSS